MSTSTHEFSDVTTSSQALKESYFATPTNFLQLLKEDYEQLPKNYSGALTKSDLDNIVHNSDDEKRRKLALVTENHFEELQKLAANPSSHDGYLTASDIGSAFNLETGNVDIYRSALDTKQIEHTLESVVAAAVLTAGALLTIECPPIAGTLAVAAIAASAAQISYFYSLQGFKDTAQTSSDQIKTAMRGWSEINSGR
jgi:hypothetical protein